jgi:carbon monoxide dehydrogenase subunit G
VRVVVDRHLAAAPEIIWDWLADPHKHIRMLPDEIRDARVLETGEVEATISAAGFTEQMVVRVVQSDPPRRLEEERVDGKRRGTTVFEVAPDGQGSRVTLTADVDMPRLVSAFAEGPMRRSLEKQLENLDTLSAGDS